MSTYAISDIHGNDNLFRRLLKSIQLKKTDKLILLGDLIDRGIESRQVIDTVFLLLDHGFDVVCVRGNHEQMLIDALEDSSKKMLWIQNGGGYTLESFGTSEIEKIPQKYVDFIYKMPYYLEVPGFIFVHAGINMLLEEPLKDIHSLLWLRQPENFLNAEWLSDRRVIHGHTPMTDMEILNESNKGAIIGIDNGVYLNREGTGGLCAINIDSIQFIIEKSFR